MDQPIFRKNKGTKNAVSYMFNKRQIDNIK